MRGQMADLHSIKSLVVQTNADWAAWGIDSTIGSVSSCVGGGGPCGNLEEQAD